MGRFVRREMIKSPPARYYSIGGPTFRIGSNSASELEMFMIQAIPSAILTTHNPHRLTFKMTNGIYISYWAKTGSVLIQGSHTLKYFGYLIRNIICLQFAPELIIDTRKAPFKEIDPKKRKLKPFTQSFYNDTLE